MVELIWLWIGAHRQEIGLGLMGLMSVVLGVWAVRLIIQRARERQFIQDVASWVDDRSEASLGGMSLDELCEKWRGKIKPQEKRADTDSSNWIEDIRKAKVDAGTLTKEALEKGLKDLWEHEHCQLRPNTIAGECDCCGLYRTLRFYRAGYGLIYERKMCFDCHGRDHLSPCKDRKPTFTISNDAVIGTNVKVSCPLCGDARPWVIGKKEFYRDFVRNLESVTIHAERPLPPRRPPPFGDVPFHPSELGHPKDETEEPFDES